MDPGQMKFLRLLSTRMTQTITYHCYNSRAWEDENDRTIKLQGDNEMELTSSEKTKPRVVTNNCDVSEITFKNNKKKNMAQCQLKKDRRLYSIANSV